jgi:LPS export ABC transporter protein LptC
MRPHFDTSVRRWLLAAALTGCLGFAAQAVAANETARESPALDIERMTFLASEAADSRLLLRADKAKFFPETDSAELMVVEATVYGDEGAVAFEMTCDRGDLDLKTNDFVARGNVLGQTDDGMKFEVDRVNYDHESGTLFTDEDILITDDGGTYRGGGFRYFVEEKRFQLLGGARVVQGQ